MTAEEIEKYSIPIDVYESFAIVANGSIVQMWHFDAYALAIFPSETEAQKTIDASSRLRELGAKVVPAEVTVDAELSESDNR